MSAEVVLGYLSGLRFLDPDLPLRSLVMTTLVVNACDASMCRLLARNAGRSAATWTLLGLVFGIWAFAAVLVLTRGGRKT
jgi:hypothetical protein